jgi:hypothetical protein
MRRTKDRAVSFSNTRIDFQILVLAGHRVLSRLIQHKNLVTKFMQQGKY